ncbi:MAG TPA: hypothetical protein VN618_03585, partial [Solirubrobacteraceae bacterium]|nr:hypothetical protein [Solirubrobacteraceae bacterium]
MDASAHAPSFKRSTQPALTRLAVLPGDPSSVTSPAVALPSTRMIEDLVAQIETRFAELGEQMTDPEVISDR